MIASDKLFNYYAFERHSVEIQKRYSFINQMNNDEINDTNRLEFLYFIGNEKLFYLSHEECYTDYACMRIGKHRNRQFNECFINFMTGEFADKIASNQLSFSVMQDYYLSCKGFADMETLENRNEIRKIILPALGKYFRGLGQKTHDIEARYEKRLNYYDAKTSD